MEGRKTNERHMWERKTMRFNSELKKGLALLGLILFSLVSVAQDDRIDSLNTELQSAKVDTHRVNLMILLAEASLDKDLNLPLRYALDAKELSEKIKYTKGIANSYRYTGLVKYFKGDYYGALLDWQESAKFFDKALCYSPFMSK